MSDEITNIENKTRNHLINHFLPTGPFSSIYSTDAKIDQIERMDNLMTLHPFTVNSDPYTSAKLIHNKMYPDTYAVNTNGPIKFNIKKSSFDKFNLEYELAEDGATLIIDRLDYENRNRKDLTWGIFKNIGDDLKQFVPSNNLKEFVSSDFYNDYIKNLRKQSESRYPNPPSMNPVNTQSFEEMVTQDLMDGNAQNLFRQLIPDPDGGYNIGIFFIGAEQTRETATLVGAMLENNNVKHITEEELIGASAEKYLYDFVTDGILESETLPINHQKINEMYKEGFNKETFQKGFFGVGNERLSENRFVRLFQSDFGELEFKYAITPLYNMLQEESFKKFGENYNSDNDFLSDKEVKVIVANYMDRLNRVYRSDLIPDYVKPAVRHITNFYALN